MNGAWLALAELFFFSPFFFSFPNAELSQPSHSDRTQLTRRDTRGGERGRGKEGKGSRPR